ncbi:MAG: T9SS type A sorting domain-containing protein [Rhizobacter sp.]|nr:T9SS type A sorting domain-containing protein [Ferruginibacter sp.]
MIRLFTRIILFFGFSALSLHLHAQVNPSVALLPVNAGGVVAQGAVMDVKVTISNTGTGNIVAFKLRPNITMPPIVSILPTAQQTGLPPNWSVVTNTGNGQIRICNGTDVIPGGSFREIFIKVQGVTIGGPAQCEVQINYGGATCAAPGPQPNGNNSIDDFAASSVTVAPGCPLTLTAISGSILCAGSTTTITANATGATGPVEFSITGGAPFQPSNIFTNVAAGTYQVTVREVNNPLSCSVSTSLTITEPAPVPTPLINIVQPTCTAPNALVTLTSTSNLTFSVDGGAYAAYPTGGYSLPAGPHTITARDGNNCPSPIASFLINAQPFTPAAPTIGTVTQPDCSVSTGSVILNNLPAGNWTIQPGNIAGNSSSTSISNLAAGSYSFTVTNDEGCTSPPSLNVIINAVIGAPDAPLVSSIQPSCTVATGAIEITSAVAGLTFSLDGSTYIAYPAGGYSGVAPGTHTLIAQNASGCLSPITSIVINPQPVSPPAPVVSVQQPSCTVASGIITVTSPTIGVTFSLDGGPFDLYPAGGYIVNAGTHTLAVQNLSGCTPNITNSILVNTQPATPLVSATFTPITCFGSSSLVTIAATSAVAPYEYSLGGGAYQTGNTFTVGAGNYTIAVKDANGCIGDGNTITIIEPAPITATASAGPIACNGGNTILTIAAALVSGPYEYSLNNGPYQINNTFTVTAGSFNINVRLVNNPSCAATVPIVVNVTQPTMLKAAANADAIAFCGGNTTASVTATGGTAPYTGTGNFTKGPGIWSFVIVDAAGCRDTAEVNILPPGCTEIEVFPNPSADNITINHSAAVGMNAYLQIFSENGARVLTHRVLQNAFLTTLNIAKLSAGYYVIVYINGNERKETKFIKTNR